MAYFWLAFSLGLFALGAFVLCVPRRWLRLLVALLSVLLAIMCTAYLVANHFTGRGIDESVIYHVVFGFEGAGFREYLGIMLLAGALLVASLAFGGLTYWLLQPRLPSQLRLAGWLALPLLALAWAVNPATRDLVTVGHQYALAETGGRLPEFYVKPGELELRQEVERPRNLVLIYAESLERTYFDEAVFPGLVPQLIAREQRALTFSGIDQLPGMGWTVAGMVGSQCGTPLGRSPNWTGEGMRGDFLPVATCLGDVLAEQDYTLHYMGGADTDFAGKQGFYRTHGFDRIDGLNQLREGLDDPDYLSHWGLYDDSLLPMVAQRFDELAETDQPFALVTLTLDTHHPDGHVSKSCRETAYRDGDNPILNAVHCTDRLLDTLLEHILSSPHADNTLVVLMSDHMAMRNTASETLDVHPRRNLFMVFGKDIDSRKVSRAGSQLDMAPTLLPLLGFDVASIGLGRDLLGESENFHERHNGSHTALRALYPRLGNLWAYPDLSNGLSVDSENRRVLVGNRRLDYPLLLQVDEERQIVGMLQESGIRDSLATLPDDTAFVWVDDCRRNALVVGAGGQACVLAANRLDEAGYQLVMERDVIRLDGDALWESSDGDGWQGEVTPNVHELLSRLRNGGSVRHERHTGDRRTTLVATPNPGMAFIGWSDITGPARFEPIRQLEADEVSTTYDAEFDVAVSAPSDSPTFRSAWVAAAVKGVGVIDQRLSPGNSEDSVARLAFWHEGVGAIDLRATGGFATERPFRFVRIDEKSLLEPARGLGVVILDAQGNMRHREVYDTHASQEESNALASRLARLEKGQLVLLASGDEFTNSLTPSLRDALVSLGFDRLDYQE